MDAMWVYVKLKKMIESGRVSLDQIKESFKNLITVNEEGTENTVIEFYLDGNSFEVPSMGEFEKLEKR